MKIQEEIKPYVDWSAACSSKDVLVHLSHPVELDFNFEANSHQFPMDQKLHALFLDASKFKKETGISSLCLGFGLLVWTWKEKSIQTPIAIQAVDPRYQKIDQQLHVETDQDWVLNPFLANYFELNLANQDLSALIEAFEKHLSLFKLEFAIQKKRFMGNFHPYRFSIIKELEHLIQGDDFSTPLGHVLGNPEHNPLTYSFPKSYFFPLDHAQRKAREAFQGENLVVQGPPGTGKSQLLTHLVADILAIQQSAFVVSEKFTALEVIHSKLKEYELDTLVHLMNGPQYAKNFVQDLKESWQLIENLQVQPTTNLALSNAYEEQLNQWLHLLQQKTVFEGVDFSTFQRLMKKVKLNEGIYLSDFPDLKNWETVAPILQEIYRSHLQHHLALFHPDFWETSVSATFEKKLLQYDKEWQNLQSLFPIKTWADVTQYHQKAEICHIFEQKHIQKFDWIEQANPTKIKKYKNLRKKYFQIQHTGTNLSVNAWKKIPNPEALAILKTNLEKTHFFNRYKLKKSWAQWNELSIDFAATQIQEMEQYLRFKEQLSKILVEFYDFNVEDPEIDITYVDQILAHDRLDVWRSIPKSDRNFLAQHFLSLQYWYLELRSYFAFQDQQEIGGQFKSLLEQWGNLFQLSTSIQLLEKGYLKVLASFDQFEDLEQHFLYTNFLRFTKKYPQFKEIGSESILNKLNQIKNAQQEETLQLRDLILFHQHRQFQAYQKLISTVPTKLTQEQKSIRTQLKNGKSILIKAFKKSRQFPTLRELIESDAIHWIKLLKPIWMGNPAVIAHHLPLAFQMEFGIIDEASQMPLQNSFGTLQRVKRVIITGDEQQMSPSHYFQSHAASEMDLLHQAQFQMKNKHLQFHYRSVHPELIAFSNTHFYQHQLVVFPTYPKAPKPIESHFIANGRFLEQKNKEEASAVAKALNTLLKTTDKIGVVAFSATQLNAIYEALDPQTKKTIEHRIAENTCFMKALEQVQGDECDCLVISMGYGKNESDEFAMRFGPINTDHGPKRLNVLFTRARKKIHFFHSVKASDFKWSDKPGVQLLKAYLQQFEHENNVHTAFQFPSGIDPRVKEQQLQIPLSSIQQNANQLYTTYHVLKSRGWDLEFGME